MRDISRRRAIRIAGAGVVVGAGVAYGLAATRDDQDADGGRTTSPATDGTTDGADRGSGEGASRDRPAPGAPVSVIDLGLGPDDDGVDATDINRDLAVVGRAANRMARWPEPDPDALEVLGTLRTDDSGEASATAVNEDGQIAGYSVHEERTHRAVRWTESAGMEELGSLDPGTHVLSRAHDINDEGTIVGTVLYDAGEDHAFRWTESVGMVDLNDLHDGEVTAFTAGAVSPGGTIAGRVTADAGQTPYVWDESNGIRTLDTPDDFLSVSVRGVTDDGVVVGRGRDGTGLFRAFRWDDGFDYLEALSDEPTAGSTASDVNERGTVVGYSHVYVGDERRTRGVRWVDGEVENLGTLGSGTWSNMRAINANGDVAGISADPDGVESRGVVWT